MLSPCLLQQSNIARQALFLSLVIAASPSVAVRNRSRLALKEVEDDEEDDISFPVGSSKSSRENVVPPTREERYAAHTEFFKVRIRCDG